MSCKYRYAVVDAVLKHSWWSLDSQWKDKITKKDQSRTTREYLRDSIDCGFVQSFVFCWPYTGKFENPTTRWIAKKIGNYIACEGEQYGIAHVDTYECDTYWRIQLAINVFMYPEVMLWYCLPYERQKDEGFFVSFNGEDAVVLTFNIDKKQ